MGELIRRLDYERRSKTLMRNSAGGQRISKEYSTPVRSANAMAQRVRDLEIEKAEARFRAFISRHAYEYRQVKRLQKNMDQRTECFDEEEFDKARSKTPRNILNANVVQDEPSTEKEDVAEMKKKKIKSANRDLQIRRSNTEEDRPNTVAAGALDIEHFKDFRMFGYRRMRSASSRVDSPQPELLDGLGKLKNVGKMKKDTVHWPRHASARLVRFVDISKTCSGVHDFDKVQEDTPGKRSFRDLREVYKTKKVEPPKPSEERIRIAKQRINKAYRVLNERILKRFRDIFEGSLLQMDDWDD